MIYWIAIAAALLIGLPFLWFVGGFATKIIWGWWPALVAIAGGAWTIWTIGIDKIWMAGLFILVAIIGVYLWQRLTLFIRVDRRLDKLFLLDD